MSRGFNPSRQQWEIMAVPAEWKYVLELRRLWFSSARTPMPGGTWAVAIRAGVFLKAQSGQSQIRGDFGRNPHWGRGSRQFSSAGNRSAGKHVEAVIERL